MIVRKTIRLVKKLLTAKRVQIPTLFTAPNQISREGKMLAAGKTKNDRSCNNDATLNSIDWAITCLFTPPLK